MNTVEPKTTVRIETIVDVMQSKAGNWTGITSAGKYYFISKSKMENLGIKKQADFKQELFALITTKTYARLVRERDLEEEGNPYFGQTEKLNKPFLNKDGEQETFDREEASAVFDDLDKAVMAHTASQRVANQAQHVVAEHAESLRRQAEEAQLDHRIALGNKAKEAGFTPDQIASLASASFE